MSLTLFITIWVVSGLAAGYLNWRYIIGLSPGSKLRLSDLIMIVIWGGLGPVAAFTCAVLLWIEFKDKLPAFDPVLWRRK